MVLKMQLKTCSNIAQSLMGYDDKTDCLCQKMDAAACHLGSLHLPFAGNFHRAQQLHTFSEYRQLVAAVAKRNRTPVKNKENRLCNTEL